MDGKYEDALSFYDMYIKNPERVLKYGKPSSANLMYQALYILKVMNGETP